MIGRVVVVQRGVCSFVAKARRVQEAGGVGVIFVNTDEELFTIGVQQALPCSPFVSIFSVHETGS